MIRSDHRAVRDGGRPGGPTPIHRVTRAARTAAPVAAILLVVGLLASCAPSAGPQWYGSAYRLVRPYDPAGNAVVTLGSTFVGPRAVGSQPAAQATYAPDGTIDGMGGCFAGYLSPYSPGYEVTMCFAGATPGSPMRYGSPGTVTVTSQAVAGGPVFTYTAFAADPQPIGVPSATLFETVAYTSCTTDEPGLDGSCLGLSVVVSYSTGGL